MDDRQPYYGQEEQPSYQKKDNSSITALILGILSLVCGITGVASLAGSIMGIIGIVQGNKNRKFDSEAKAGFVMSIIGLILSSIVFIFFLAFLGIFGSMFHAMYWPMGRYW
jgi:lysylphosphatidylglycerol synthetase-like protein (DUF2156 family)